MVLVYRGTSTAATRPDSPRRAAVATEGPAIMLTCPMCRKQVALTVRTCPRCSTDLSLLVDHLGHVSQSLARAADQTRQGQLGPAVWTYLEVLEADPENP